MSGETITQKQPYGEGLTALLAESDSVEVQVVGSSNTHLQNSQINPLESGGVDSVVWNLGVTWDYEFPFEDLLHALDSGKLQAQEKHHDITIPINGHVFAIAGGGKGTGGGKGIYYSYFLKRGGITLKLTKGATADEAQQNANVMVECGSLFLMLNGIDGAWATVRNIVEALGGRIFWHKFSRLDICADLPGIDTADLARMVWEKKCVTRATKKDYHEDGSKLTGVTVGKGDIMLRIYDKLHEVRHGHPDLEKEKYLIEKRWGKSPDHAMRVEYQLRRPALKELGINTMGDFYAKGAALAAYLTGDWFRIVKEEPDRKNNHQTRQSTAPEWVAVQEAFRSWMKKPRESVERKQRGMCKDPIRLVKQASGCILAAVADLTQELHMTREEFRVHAQEVLEWGIDSMGDSGFREKFTKKAAQRVVSYGGAVLPNSFIATCEEPWVDEGEDWGVVARWKGAQAHG